MLAHLGWVARLQGLHEEAVVHGRRAVALGDRAGHRWWRPAARALLAGTLVECGAAAEAVGLLAEVVAEVRHEGAEAHLLRCLAPLAEATGDGDVLAEADALLRRVDTPPGGAWLTGMDAYTAIARAWTARRAGPGAGGAAPAADRRHPDRLDPGAGRRCVEDGRAAARLGAAEEARAALCRARTWRSGTGCAGSPGRRRTPSSGL